MAKTILQWVTPGTLKAMCASGLDAQELLSFKAIREDPLVRGKVIYGYVYVDSTGNKKMAKGTVLEGVISDVTPVECEHCAGGATDDCLDGFCVIRGW